MLLSEIDAHSFKWNAAVRTVSHIARVSRGSVGQAQRISERTRQLHVGIREQSLSADFCFIIATTRQSMVDVERLFGYLGIVGLYLKAAGTFLDR